MRIVTRIGILLLIVGMQGCATYGRLSGVPSDGQKSVFKDGRKTLISIKQNIVAVSPDTEIVTSGQRGDFVIAVNNGTSQDILFSTEHITASADTNGQLSMLKVFSYDELIAEEKKRQAWAAVGAALQGFADSMNAANAGYSNTSGTYSGSVYSNYGKSANVYGSYSSTTYNSAAAQAARNTAQANSEARFARLQVEGRENLKNLSSTILKKETIFPGAWQGGIVKVALPEVVQQPQEIKLVVTVAGEPHEFTFTQEKVQGK
ncbi:hypothetical protein G9409_09780 [Chlorobium sp. BLA1]|uniref:hypothetical protein n=1 Tax=Candidatus Chlorobium masyuteum TaxID=2716876 RepID=UPI00141E78F9|nr:hypothetical protein [Candidatus Chlorobium masyuteum]NHQ60863.1 hypothetical protein [Candidatus Chlorobium masyuteum]